MSAAVDNSRSSPRVEARQPNGERHDYVSIALSQPAALEEIMRLGTRPDPEKLAGWEFRGYNTPEYMGVIQNRKFKKGFYRDAATPGGRLRGYNVQTRQSPLGAPWVDVPKGNDSHKFGWYDVYPVDLAEPDNKYPNALLINYNVDRNLKFDPTRTLRDYLVQVYPDNPDLYLGKAYLALGPVRIHAAYFVLERSNRSSLAA